MAQHFHGPIHISQTKIILWPSINLTATRLSACFGPQTTAPEGWRSPCQCGLLLHRPILWGLQTGSCPLLQPLFQSHVQFITKYAFHHLWTGSCMCKTLPGFLLTLTSGSTSPQPSSTFTGSRSSFVYITNSKQIPPFTCPPILIWPPLPTYSIQEPAVLRCWAAFQPLYPSQCAWDRKNKMP